ncbi:MAG: hypothetical protein KatS3mg077_2231 [Candidatus Binatia bacterium]|nr:MAG: hypothetical protein KatS3mg077_2231 [Candidatus Binatia bacterium]
MKSWSIATVLSGALAGIALSVWQSSAAQPGKYLIILQAGKQSHEGHARAYHALLYAKELQENSHTVVLVFDGAGTEWVEEWTRPGSADPLVPLYREVRAKGITNVVCDFCANAFQVKNSLKERGTQLVSEYSGHPSIAKWANQGYQIIVL